MAGTGLSAGAGSVVKRGFHQARRLDEQVIVPDGCGQLQANRQAGAGNRNGDGRAVQAGPGRVHAGIAGGFEAWRDLGYPLEPVPS